MSETTFTESARYLILPIQNEGESGKVQLYFADSFESMS